eukprot:EG_transcript_10078
MSLAGENIPAFVSDVVDRLEVIDVHTHLFPPSHGPLMLWGIDELLTYHYLVSEFFMVAPMSITPQSFFSLTKQKQADLVWQHLFVHRLPLSEAQLGVVTTLRLLGLADLVEQRDLAAIRAWFAAQDREAHVERVFTTAKVKYVVMTNVPFDKVEAEQWLKGAAPSPRFKAALRIDPLLKGDWGAIAACLRGMGLPDNLEGARDYLRHWARRMAAIYLMASTPADFRYGPTDVPRQPGWPSATQLIDEVMVPVARELQLPLALKLGAMRGMNPELDPCGGGDGVVVADVTPLRLLCAGNPDLKFLATFLSRVNQHEVCVLTQKFRNLHIYGCWWFCNNPSIIQEMTRMRLEMLGTAFTAQHSDARILEQLLYKWRHSRDAIKPVLVEQLQKLSAAGWPLSREDAERDIRRLFGGSYEEFMEK